MSPYSVRPGSGKTMLARRIPSILPNLTFEEALETTKIHSVAGELDKNSDFVITRPFRAPHHTISGVSMIGGGKIPKPGEISLAHNGVLFLDELPEFNKNTLEVLRGPLEDRVVTISRINAVLTYPCNFMFVASMNPCPCGNYPNLEKCTCTPSQIQQYLGRISQPFLDRIDICVEAPRISYEELSAGERQESSESIRRRVCQAREIQNLRYLETTIRTNSMLSAKDLQRYCVLGAKEERLMKQAFNVLGLTARTYHKILRVARTIADMEMSEQIREHHLKEAIGYRTMEKKYWGR